MKPGRPPSPGPSEKSAVSAVAYLFLFLGLLRFSPLPARAGDHQLEELKTVEQVRKLSPEQAALHYPVHLRAIVMVFDENLLARISQDETVVILLAIVLGASAWVVVLLRRVQAQTGIIRQKLQVEATLKERYVDLFENAKDMVYTHDLQGRITSINQTGERLLQRRREEILSRNIVDLVVEEERAAASQWLDHVLKGVEPPTVEWDFSAASGQRVKLEISTRLIEQNGQLVEVEGIARDITERKRLEREILEISNREQRRIGHDLHDGVCQQLAGIAYMTSSLAESLEEKGAPEASQAERISSLINAAISQTRGVARGLFPVRLEENGLVSALEELAANAGELFKISCRFASERPPLAVDNEIALHLYYIVLEAVANAAKHGRARNILITLEPAADRFALEVRDDGIGFSPSDHPQTGMGIRIMHYRARVIGATLTLHSEPGCGTHVTCLFHPVSRELSQSGKIMETMNTVLGSGA